MAPYLGTETPASSGAAPSNIPIVASPAAPELFGWPKQSEGGYQIKETPMGTKRSFKIVVLGAGASGINFTKISRERLQNVEVVCYEKNEEVGGTWLENV